MSLEDVLSNLPVIRHIKNEMVKRSDIRNATQISLKLQIDDYLQRHLHGNPRYSDRKRLTSSEYAVFSQYGEDGAIAEIFRRIGDGTKSFVELGVGDGLENNTAYLLTKNWSGAWIEGSPKNTTKIQQRFSSIMNSGRLRLKNDRITAENVESLFATLSVPAEFDLLSLDIDLNTYWVWRAIKAYRPRVVVIEYNAVYPPQDEWIVRYDAAGSWDGSSHMGASLKSLCLLGEQKGYHLVGCSFAGSNAFFVRRDVASDLFCAPFTPENHYEPPRYFLYTDRGHRRGWGEFVTTDRL